MEKFLGIAQNPTLSTDLKEWSNENFETLKITHRQYLPLIRYFHIPGEVIWEKVKPHKKILEQLWDDIIQHYISPNKSVTSPVLPARIVSNPELSSRTTSTPNCHQTILDSNKERTCRRTFIMEGMVFTPKTFWNMCHRHSDIIVIVKIAGTDEIVDGYNPLAWDKLKSGFMETDNSFVFSLKNDNIKNSIHSRVKSSGGLYYPLDQNMYGPWFGFNEFMIGSNVSDFTQDKLCQCKIDDILGAAKYEKPIRTTD
ncbi:hypothetical protein Glove_552g11 [Diversispora epigaea]|uniref:TLDc domain-containing protein n=1 Tax=Diversispora epigaea TaxID=1348612 RepID=A0A397GDZ9_9GLOM|nr:hypothetical protein Glove_552g11 [Diversispora epigaea]